MAEITVHVNVQDVRLSVMYAVFLPNGDAWVYDHLNSAAYRTVYYGGSISSNASIVIPVDLITAARLGWIKHGDDSGLTDAQWAWIKLIGLVGETK